MTNCRRCNRGLKNPVYIKLEIGPVCLRKQKSEDANRESNSSDRHNLPFNNETMDIVCVRTDEAKSFNFPHRIVKHSPTGMEWGYGGSGPADFALNALLMFVTSYLAEKHHQDFKWKFVAPLPKQGGIIKGEDIIKWLESQGCSMIYAGTKMEGRDGPN